MQILNALDLGLLTQLAHLLQLCSTADRGNKCFSFTESHLGVQCQRTGWGKRRYDGGPDLK